MKAPNLQTLPLQDPPGALTRSDVLPGNHPLRTKRSSERSELHNNVAQRCATLLCKENEREKRIAQHRCSHLFHKDTQVHIILIYSNGVKLKARPRGSTVKQLFCSSGKMMMMMFITIIARD